MYVHSKVLQYRKTFVKKTFFEFHSEKHTNYFRKLTMRLQKCKKYENSQKRVFQKTSFYADNLKCLHYPT